MRAMLAVSFAVLSATLLGFTHDNTTRGDVVDLAAVHRIQKEASDRSQVMETASYLTDVYGARLTGSPAIEAATQWARDTLKGWQIANVRSERFRFGRGWVNRRFVAAVAGAGGYPLVGYPKAWTAGTPGPITAEAVMASIGAESDFEKWRGKLRGKIVLTARSRTLTPRFEPLARRLTDAELDTLGLPATDETRQAAAPPRPRFLTLDFQLKRQQFFKEEGVIAHLEPSVLGDGGTFFVQAAPGASREPDADVPIPQVVLAVEQYGRLARTLAKGLRVEVLLDIENAFLDNDLYASNLIAELTGSRKADELVLMGAHLDSWHAGTGATDNAAGVAVMMEAMRILKHAALPLQRTVRLALWSGEEQGLLGSRAYVRQHVADPATMRLEREHSQLSAYFNLDNGTGRIRGIYLQGNEAAAPVFRAWLEPHRSAGMTTIALRGTGNTDHVSFDEVGIPGFQFIQDPLEYHSRTHHSNQDVYERLRREDLIHNAIVVASFVYHAANREEKLPRKTLPQPRGTRPPPDTGR